MLRVPLAWVIAARRAKTAGEIYEYLGGGSPLLPNTEAQASALQATLGSEYRCFVAMRYWHPLTAATVTQVQEWKPDEVILLPLYPQFSTTTTASSFRAWHAEAARQGLSAPTREIRSYPTASGLIAALVANIEAGLASLRDRPFRLLLSAHGLPLKIVAAGDPYPEEVRATAQAIVAALPFPVDWTVCYQSRVGPLAWLGPSVDDELRRAACDGIGVVIAPIAFVSEHSETLVELDRDYRRVAEELHIPFYERIPTVGANPRFIAALAAQITGDVDAEAVAMAAAYR